jgi:pentatricopeptide repeat protein
VSTTSAIARRTGAAAGKRFGRPGPSSTLLYSTIFAAAAVADGRAKRKRREQWDAAITNVKEDLDSVGEEERREALGARQEKHDGRLNWFEIWRERLPDGLVTKYISEIAGTDVVYDRMEILDYEQEYLDDRTKDFDPEEPKELWKLLDYNIHIPGGPRPEWTLNLGPDLEAWNLPPQSLWSMPKARAKRLDRRYSKKKIKTLERSVAKLIHQLMLKSAVFGVPPLTLGEIPASLHPIASVESKDLYHKIQTAQLDYEEVRSLSQEDFLQRLEAGTINESRVLSPHYLPDEEVTRPKEMCGRLNSALKSLFEEYSDDMTQTRPLVADICHNLLISPVPPDVQTYNILIAGFARREMTHQCDAAIRSMLETSIRPNEVTCTHILNYLRERGIPDRFTEFVGLMRGQKSGLMLARPDIRVSDAGRFRLVQTPNGKVIQKVYPTPMVFNALMRGVLSFTGLDRAVEIYDIMKEDCWGMDYKGLLVFLRAAVHEGDWVNGNFIWEEIKALRAKTRGKVQICPSAFTLFMRLCHNTDHCTAYEMTHSEAIRAGYSTAVLMREGSKLPRHARPSADVDSEDLRDAETARNVVNDSKALDRSVDTIRARYSTPILMSEASKVPRRVTSFGDVDSEDLRDAEIARNVVHDPEALNRLVDEVSAYMIPEESEILLEEDGLPSKISSAANSDLDAIDQVEVRSPVISSPDLVMAEVTNISSKLPSIADVPLGSSSFPGSGPDMPVSKAFVQRRFASKDFKAPRFKSL